MNEGISEYLFEQFVDNNRDWIGGQLEYCPKGMGFKTVAIIFEITHRMIGNMNIFSIRTNKGLYEFSDSNTKSSKLVEVLEDGWNIFSAPAGSEFRINKPNKSTTRKTTERVDNE